MPDISKLSGTLIDSVGKIDGVLKGDIASIVGLTVPSGTAYTPPLDVYTGASAAYSVRKLSSTYSGPCIEAYRVSDGATQDIGFDGDGLIDTAAIISFASGGEVRVQTWYDQSGNALDGVQIAAASMPQIYDGASVTIENFKPCIRFDNVDDRLLVSSLSAGANPGTIVGVLANIGSGGIPLLGTKFNGPYILRTNSGSTGSAFRDMGTVVAHVNGLTNPSYTQDDSYNDFNSAQGLAFIVGDTSQYRTNDLQIVHQRSVDWQELIFWDSDQSSNRTGIESNFNSYYQITNLPDYTSGFLADYSGSEAAYSVRALSNTAIKALRVRRTVSPFDEKTIGFDSNGDLDTAAITAFGGSDPLTVSAWFDQSGKGNDLTQTSANNQPAIYDGTSVVTEGSRPALDFERTGVTPSVFVKTMAATLPAGLSQPVTYSYVYQMTDDSGYKQMGSLGGQSVFSLGLLNAGAFLNVQRFQGYHVASAIFDTTSLRREDGAQTNSGNAGTNAGNTALRISSTSSGNAWQDGKMQEFVVWNTNQSTDGNISGIETNQNTYYSIY